MKRINGLLPLIADCDNLRLAFWKAQRGKSDSTEVVSYRTNLNENLRLLRHQILSGEVEVGNYRFFKIYDPKERQICAGAFSERVLHHALMNVCHDFFERPQIYDSYASRKGKGTYAALNRARSFTKRFPFFLKLDVRKFFYSIHHDTLKNQLDTLFKEERLMQIFFKIIDSFEDSPGRGVPIGNLTSQYFANHYLCGLDHHIKEKLHIPGYVRYMDDMVLWHQEKSVLKSAYVAVNEYVNEELICFLKNPVLNWTTQGLPFLGYVLRPYNTRLSQSSMKRFVKKAAIISRYYNSGEWDENRCQRHILPLIAFTRHANADAFRKSLFLQNKI